MTVGEIKWASNRPNAAISADLRSQVADCIVFAIGSSGRTPREYDEALQELADRLDQPGPPLVSTADIAAICELVGLIAELEDLETLVHPWGEVTYMESVNAYTIKDRARSSDEVYAGRIVTDGPIDAAQMMYEDHLRSRDLGVPQRA